MRFLNYILVLIIILVLGYFVLASKSPYHTITGKTMGTYYNVKIRSDKIDNFLQTEIQELLDRIVAQNSIFDADSEISIINKNSENEWIPLSEDMSLIMKKAYSIYKDSNGGFDPTVGAIIELWGFGKKKISRIPKEEEIKEVLKYTGFNKVSFSKDYTMIKKTNANTQINLSGIVKGFGVDRVAEFLLSKGYKDFIIEIGGEVRAHGSRVDGGNGWNLAILAPIKGKSINYNILAIKDYSAATSGDYRNYYTVDGDVFSHTIDPKTGKPVVADISSVTVLHKNCMEADALATAIITMGKEKGLKFANNKGLEAIIFVKNKDGGFTLVTSNKATKYIAKNKIED